MRARLELTRQQILAFRRRVGGLEARQPTTPDAMRQAAWAGLQDSMPRAALLSLHARLDAVEPSTWDDPSLAQLWGPRYNTYVVPKCDFAIFSLGRLPDNAQGPRARGAHSRAPARPPRRQADDGPRGGRALGIGPAFRYAAATGTIAIRWDGARAPTIWTVAAAEIEPADACRELARRYLHVFGPTTAVGFARWAGISRRAAATAFASLEESLLPVRSPLGDEWLLAADEPAMQAAEGGRRVRAPAAERRCVLPPRRAERDLLVPYADRRERLWTSRVWPGALLVDGEIRGTWRRAQHTVRIDAWSRLSRNRARCGRGRGESAAAAGPRARHRGGLGEPHVRAAGRR